MSNPAPDGLNAPVVLPRDLSVIFPFGPREIWAKKHGEPFMRILTNAERERLRVDTLYISRALTSIVNRR